MQSFDEIKDALLKHLPRPAFGSGIHVSKDGIKVDGDGISIGDVSHFLGDLTKQGDFLPEDLPARDIRLAKLDLKRNGGRWGCDLDFTLAWDDADLEVIEGVPLKFSSAHLSFTKVGERLLGHADLTLEINGLDVSVALELPSKLVKGRVVSLDKTKAKGFLGAYGLGDAGRGLKLRELAIDASIPFRRLHAHLELENLFEIGPVKMTEAVADIVLAQNVDAMRADLRTVLHIDRGAKPAIEITAHGEIDSKGWLVEGELATDHLGFRVPDLANALARKLGVAKPKLPAPIRNLGIHHLAVALNTRDKTFSFDCALDWQQSGSELVLHADKTPDGLKLSASLYLDDLIFRIELDKGENPVLLAAFESAGTHGLTADKLLSAIGGGQVAGMISGAGIDMDIKAAAVAMDSSKNMLMAAEVAAGIDLSKLGDLPVFGMLLPDGASLGMTLSPIYLSQGFDDGALDAAKGMLPGAITLPDGLKPGMSVAATVNLGGGPFTVDTGASAGTLDRAGPPEVADTSKDSDQAEPLPNASPIEWKPIDKSIGPIHLSRFGYALSSTPDQQIDIALDGSMSLAGLTLGLNGLGAQYNFKTQELSPRLQGLSLDFKKGPLEIGGAFLNSDGDFAGSLVIGTSKFSLNAMGAFKMLEGKPSMFAYAVLDMPLGGPVFFFVEGLAAGFGVHRKMLMPKITEVHDHPLIKGASKAPPKKKDVKPEQELRKLHDYVSPKLGEYFFAAGVKFNSFRLLHGFGVVVVSFGKSFELDLIGTASFSTPPELPPSVPALAKVELDLIAHFAPADGILQVEARLNPKSYVYGPLCHLSGGFAFYAWFTGDRAGDFVLSIGGYRRGFDKPEGYPDVPRVELKYQISEDVYLKGDAYFALMPTMMMAGGGLHAQVNLGKLHAWADLTVDFTIAWEPFHYDAAMHIEIGAEYGPFSTTASADLHIWGPKFAGYAKVDWSVFSFDVEFGSGLPLPPGPITVAKFKSSFLDVAKKADEAKLVGAIVASGGIGSTPDGHDIVSGQGLKFGVSSRVPFSSANLVGKAVAHVKGSDLNIAPIGGKPLGASELNVAITHIGHGQVKNKFKAKAVQTQFPPALWGKDFHPNENAPAVKATGELEIVPAEEPAHQHSKHERAGKLWENPAMIKSRKKVRTATVPTTFTVRLEEIGPKKISVIKDLRGLTGMGLKQAKDLIESAPVDLATGLTATQANEFKTELSEVGAKIRVIGKGSSRSFTARPFDSKRADLILHDVGPSTVTMVQLVKSVTGRTLSEVKNLIIHTPATIKTGMETAKAEELKSAMEGIGAQVTLVPHVVLPQATDFPMDDLAALGLTMPEPGAATFDVILWTQPDDLEKAKAALVTALGITKTAAAKLLKDRSGVVARGLPQAEAKALAEALRATGARVWRLPSGGAQRHRSKDRMGPLGGPALELAHV